MFGRIGLIILLLAALLVVPCSTPAHANGAGAASGGLAGCSSRSSGKELHNCVADVLDRLAAQNSYAPEMQTEIMRAASGLRAAANKAQALLAITQCQNVIATALKQAVASGSFVRGFGRAEGLGHIARVIAQTVRLIQAKG
jgi:hypothetical protein